MRRRWGQRADSRQEQTARYLSRVRVRLPRELKGQFRSRSLKPTKDIVASLAPHAERAPLPILRWGAQQATLLRAESVVARRIGKEASPTGKAPARRTREKGFLSKFVEILDYASTALILKRDGKGRPYAQKLELTKLSGQDAVANAKAYHDLLARMDRGYLPLKPGEDALEAAAMLGVSPGALVARNGPRVLNQIVNRGARTARLRVIAPQPLAHRHEVFRLPKGRAWIWVHPDDKQHLGPGYGWCVTADQRWRNRLQFVVVDAENRPHVLLTIDFEGAGAGGDENRFMDVDTVTGGGLTGRARINHQRMREQFTGPLYGQLKGRYNERPPLSPYREDVIRWVSRHPFGPMRPSKKETAAPDWAATLTVPDDIRASKANWKAVGGATSVFATADALDRLVTGEGGPSEETLSYFGKRPGDWLKTPLAPLVMAAMGPEKMREIAPNLPTELLSEQIRVSLRGGMPRVEGPEGQRRGREVVAQVLGAKRRGVTVEPETVRDVRGLIAHLREGAARLTNRKAVDLLRKAAISTSIAVDVEKTGQALFRLFEVAPERLLQFPESDRLKLEREVLYAYMDPTMNALVCEMIFEAMHEVKVPWKKRVAQGRLVSEIVAANVAVAGSKTPLWKLRELDIEDQLPRELLEPAGLEDVNVSIAWALQGEESWHCPTCAGFWEQSFSVTTQSPRDMQGARPVTDPETGRLWGSRGVWLLDCVDFSLLFYPELLVAWDINPFGGFHHVVDRWALAPYLVDTEPHWYTMESLGENPDAYEEQYLLNMLSTGEDDIVMTLGLLSGPPAGTVRGFFMDLFEAERRGPEYARISAGLSDKAVAEIAKMKRKLSSRERRLLDALKREIRRAAAKKTPPTALWSRIMRYQREWTRVRGIDTPDEAYWT